MIDSAAKFQLKASGFLVLCVVSLGSVFGWMQFGIPPCQFSRHLTDKSAGAKSIVPRPPLRRRRALGDARWQTRLRAQR